MTAAIDAGAAGGGRPAASRDWSSFARRGPDGLLGIDLAVEGIHCAACMGTIERGLAGLPDIAGVRVNLTQRRVRVAWRGGDAAAAACDGDAVVDALARLGYRAHPFDPGRADIADGAEMRMLMKCLAVAGFAAMNVMLLSVSVWSGNVTDITPETRDLFHWVSAAIALPAAAYAGRPFFLSAFRALKARRLNMDVPISLGVTLALVLSLVQTQRSAEHAYFDSAVMLLFFLLLGRVLEAAMRRRTRATAENLAALRSVSATRIDADGRIREVPLSAVAIGDRILVGPGERVPLDGIVAAGRSAVDQSLVTGETAPAPVGPGTAVHAGTLNGEGALTVEVRAAAGETLLDRVNALLDGAMAARSRSVVIADRVGRAYAPVVHLAALSTFLGWMAFGASWETALVVAITVLIITCPCALALAVPAVQVVASGALFRAGVLLNAGDALERIATVDTVVFDKTGTLTLPEPRIANRDAVPVELVAAAAGLAAASRHPLAAAIAAAVPEAALPTDLVETRGKGVAATIGGVPALLGSPAFVGATGEAAAVAAAHPLASLVAVRLGDRPPAVIAIDQALRPDAFAVVAELKARGLAVAILSGDRPAPVAAAAAALGIADFAAGVDPAEKIARIEALKAAGHRVLMVGDGLNDAPALAAANASLSPASAVTLAQAAADAVFLGDRLAPVVAALDIGRRARRIMIENLGFALAYNLLAVPLAIAGLATPLVAALAMSSSSLVVTVNALRARSTWSAAGAAGPNRAATRGAGDGPRPLDAVARLSEVRS